MSTPAPEKGTMSTAPITPAVTDDLAADNLADGLTPVEPLSEPQVRSAVALHVAATLLPAKAPLKHREAVRSAWVTALQTIMEPEPGWAIAYVPGVHYGDNDTYAVHLDTGTVFGGDNHATAQQRGESTQQWVTRLTPHLTAP